MDGMNGNFPGGNATNMLQQMSNYNNIQNIPNAPVQQPPNIINNNNNSPSEHNPKRQAVFDRLKKRMGLYRKKHNESIPRFEQTFNGICEQQSVETNVLQKRFIESKAKRVAKKADKKQTDVTPNNVTVTQTKQIKRPAMDDLENDGESLQPAAKIPATGPSSSGIDNMKFQVEIVQQLEFTTSVANLQPQQISTNVTVKAMTNGSLKYEPQEMKPIKMEPGKMQPMHPLPPTPDILQDFKQEPDNEFADLDFGGLANFMANDENELKKLFSNISEVFDQDLFDQDKIKQEPRAPQLIPQMPQQNINQMNQINQQFNQYVMPESCQMQKPMMQQQILPQQQQQQHRMYQPQQVQQQIPSEMSPAAQTLKNMAQQHQVKTSMAMNYMRPVVQPMVPQMNPQQQPNMAQRMPYQQAQQQAPQQQFNDYNNQFHKNQIQMPFPPEMIKQEMMMQQQPQMAPMHQMKPMMNHQMIVHPNEDIKMNQQYQQYQNTQFVANHQPPPQQRNHFNPNPNTMNIHMKQTQMMNIQQGGGGGNIQMQGGQHMHFAGDMKMGDGGNFTMQQQQNMYFNHHTHQPNTHPQQYGNMQAMQKRPQHHQPMGGGEGPTNTYNMMQSQSMSFTQ